MTGRPKNEKNSISKTDSKNAANRATEGRNFIEIRVHSPQPPVNLVALICSQPFHEYQRHPCIGHTLLKKIEDG
jgi:hypothetical protein